MSNNQIRPFVFIFAALLGFSGLVQEAHPFWGKIFSETTKNAPYLLRLGKIPGALPDNEVARLAAMINKSGDIKNVRNTIGKMNLPQGVVVDTFLRIAIKQGKLSKKEAETFLKNLNGVNGFGSTMAKTLGVSSAKTKGHLNELRIASNANENGFKVLGIGGRFDDGIKRGATDIDILLSKNGKVLPVEAKDWKQITWENMITIRKDMDSLGAFKRTSTSPSSTHPILTFTNPPENKALARLITKEAEKQGVQVVYGPPASQLMQSDQLLIIL
jgi:hypothetical protein